MNPDLELVEVGANESFKVWSHGYPFRTVRWHFHPEYEIHLITATSGRMFVGDHVGTFRPGNLVMTGPNLPHNWISDVPDGEEVPERCLVLQFSAAFADGCVGLFPELGFVSELLAASSRGIMFSAASGERAEPCLRDLLVADGSRRIMLFLDMLDLLHRDGERQVLASHGYQSSDVLNGQPLNHVLRHIRRNLSGDLRERDLATLSGYSSSAFSRAFRRHTGMNFKPYLNGLRIKHACDLLVQTERRVSDICFEAGFNNLSNFNRQFTAQKAMPPSLYREHHRANAAMAETRHQHQGGHS